MNRKKRVLFVSEASYLSTGYATYSREVLNRLHSTGKYELAEFSIYGGTKDERRSSIPWKNYPNLPDNDKEREIYNSQMNNQFGAWRFERLCLDFKPDVVLTIRDFWMDSYVRTSAFRRLFRFVWMPTVDAVGQSEEWLSVFSTADDILTYSRWAGTELSRLAGDTIANSGTASPSATSDFRPVESLSDHKERFGIRRDARIIGTVMRNQRRKLYPDLFEAFSKYLKKTGDKNTYLYCHTGYPDNGWDFSKLLIEYGISSRVYFTYTCKCGYYAPCKFSDVVQQCPSCKEFSFATTNVNAGLSVDKLVSIYQLFDFYAQIANCFPAGEKILTNKGWTNIESVQIGDMAWTHKNRWRPITHTWKNLQKSRGSKVLEISACSDYDSLRATEDHEFPAYTKNEFRGKRSVREQVGDVLRSNRDLPEMGRYSLDQLSIGDILYYPINDDVQDNDTISIGDLSISTDDLFCRWLGLYVADGSSNVSTSNGSVRITSHLNESECHALCDMVMLRLSNGKLSTNYYKNRLALNKEIYNKPVAKYFKENCGQLDTKRFPEWVMQLPVSKQTECLIGLFMGDGHCSIRRGIKTSILCTISRPLADQIKQILRRLRVSFNVRKVIKEGNRKPQYRFEVYGDIQNGEILSNRHNTRNFYYGNHHYIQISDIKEVEYNGDVYCITVDEDHTMTTSTCTTFQCEGYGIPCVEAAACGIPLCCTDYSAMKDFPEDFGAIPVKVKALYNELETGCYRAIPDVDHIAQIFEDFFSLPEEMRNRKRAETRQKFEQNSSWDRTARKWEECIDRAEFSDWSVPPILKQFPEDQPTFENNKDFIDAMMQYGTVGQDLMGSYDNLALLRDLNFGMFKASPCGFFTSEGSAFGREGYKPMNHEFLANAIKAKLNENNYWERARVGMGNLAPQEWLA